MYEKYLFNQLIKHFEELAKEESKYEEIAEHLKKLENKAEKDKMLQLFYGLKLEEDKVSEKTKLVEADLHTYLTEHINHKKDMDKLLKKTGLDKYIKWKEKFGMTTLFSLIVAEEKEVVNVKI